MKLFATTSLAIGLVALIASGSRGPLFSFFAVTGLLLIVGWQLGSKTRVIVTVALTAALVAFIFLRVEGIAQALLAFRFGGLVQYSDDPSASLRVSLFRDALQIFADHPIWGGALELPGQGYPHNVLIESLMTTGIIGAFLFTWLLAGGIVAAARLAVFVPQFAWIALLFIQQLVAVQFSGAIGGSPEMWALLAGVVVIARQLQLARAEHAGVTTPAHAS